MTSTQLRRGLLSIAFAVVGVGAFAFGHRSGFWAGRNSLPVVRPFVSVDRPEEELGRVDICLHTPTPVKPAHAVNGQIDQTIHGTVVGFGAALSVPPLTGHDLFCEMEPQWYVDVSDAQKARWRLLYSVSGIVVPSPALRIGTRVTVRLRAHWGFGKAAGVIVSDAAGVVFAAEQGAFGHGLEQEDIEPLRIAASDAIGVKHDGCGDAVLHVVEVHGDSATRVLPGRIGTVGLKGTSYRFWNAASYNWINISCTDMLDTMSWFLWRQ